ncbi:MAG: flagellar biosynthesis protein FlhF [Pyrinomonadaceae bacterium]
MMNVKKYRGETTREALEKIKMDLGENAFVLETKQVRTGGFLGLRSKTQVEISATPSFESNQPAEKMTKTDGGFPNSSILNLTDDAPAVPGKLNETDKKEKVEIMNVLQTRAASVQKFDKVFPYVPKASGGQAPAPQKNFEPVEISPEAPRLVHSKKEPVEIKPVETVSVEPVQSENPSTNVSSRELELLRAELREVKFSISNFSSRQQIPIWNNGVEIDVFSEVFDPPFSNAYVELTAMGLSPEFSHALISEVIPDYKKGTIALNEITRESLKKALLNLVKFESDPLSQEEPSVLAVIGATGVGKTTTIAKLAARVALQERRRVELVTLDTYRIAAVEQLKTYAEIIGAGCHVVRSVLELDATIRRLPNDATILIDTTGRNPLDLADQHELSDYLSRRKEIRKCLAVQATTHPGDALAAVKKFELYGADCLALTKLDETTRPGAMLELIAQSSLPLTYLCMGQRVPEDLKPATPENFAARIFGQALAV